MNVCRICLNTDPNMDMFEVKIDISNDTKSFVDVVLFCLNVKVIADSKITTKICDKCYEKTMLFNEFKLLAMKSDSYLKTTSDTVFTQTNDGDVELKLENFTIDEDVFDNNISILHEVKYEKCTDDGMTGDHSDDEFLSEIKKIQIGSVDEDNRTNGEMKRKRGKEKQIKCTITDGNKIKKKRGRKKKVIDDTKVVKEKICETCGKTFKDLKSHLEVHKPKDQGTYYNCTACDKTFKTKLSRNKHFKRKHLGIKKECTICKKKVTCLKSHHLTIHDKDSMRFECTLCGQKFLSQSKLNEHMNYHTKDKPYQCEVCEKRFRLKLCLITHVRSVHNKERPHLCQFCSKSFYKKYHLQVHLRSHTKEKPYECKECGKFFSSTSVLKGHQIIHSDVKMFNCEVCDMSFVKSSYLKTHMLSHTKDKRFPCQFCDVKFHRSDHRKRHEWTAHKRHLAVMNANI